ncbi:MULTISPECIES: hypothetical protein [unclassified Mesorhizobium]|uniref:hypothetical protein n=1 Tax=unclassified Mesorhizobium TaxID=325217 RepID=UPI001678AC01|nr:MULTISPECIES: hypothetical protein [unclassified Mesorhizobium]
MMKESRQASGATSNAPFGCAASKKGNKPPALTNGSHMPELFVPEITPGTLQ